MTRALPDVRNRHAPRSVPLQRRDPVPPVDGFAIGGHPIQDVSDDLGVCSTATRPAEFPQFAGRPMIVVDRLVDVVAVDFAGRAWLVGLPVGCGRADWSPGVMSPHLGGQRAIRCGCASSVGGVSRRNGMMRGASSSYLRILVAQSM
jgi:hypothetical protein